MSKSSLWAQYDAMILHSGKWPAEQIHVEGVTDEEQVVTLSKTNEEARLPGLCRAFVFATGGAARGVFLASEFGSSCDHLSVDQLFPNGAISIKLLEMPGTSMKLMNDWRILISSGRAPAPTNDAIRSYFNISWEGNIVIACYHQMAPNWPKMNNVPLALTPFIVLIVKSFLGVYLAYNQAMEGSAEPKSNDSAMSSS